MNEKGTLGPGNTLGPNVPKKKNGKKTEKKIIN